jgi:CBS domain-containing protein
MNTKQLIRVRDVMKSEFITIDGVATVQEALRSMKSHMTSVLVVNKRHQNDEYGMITAGDVARNVLARDRAPDRVNVYEVMAKPVISVSPDMDIRYCSKLFARYDLGRAPVIDSGEVIGTVSPNALVLDGLFRLMAP